MVPASGDNLVARLSSLQESLVRVETTLELTKDHPLRIRLLEQATAKSSWLHSIFTASLTAIVVTVANVAITGSNS
jgi:hypothetical protein